MVLVSRAKKIEKLGLFLSQHLTNHIALPIRDAISEELLVQRNILLADIRIEGHHNAPPTPARFDYCIRKSSELARALMRGNDFGARKAILSNFRVTQKGRSL